MRWFTFFCILICISAFQSTMIKWITIGSAVPDLYFSLVVFYSFLTDIKRNTITNWFTGLSKDLLSEGSLGINSVFFVAIGLLIWSIRGILYKGHLITQVLITFIFSVIYNIFYAAYVAVSFRSLNLLPTLWVIFICSLYTAVIIPVLFWILGKFQPNQRLFSVGDR